MEYNAIIALFGLQNALRNIIKRVRDRYIDACLTEIQYSKFDQFL